jgi:hypothetical protein
MERLVIVGRGGWGSPWAGRWYRPASRGVARVLGPTSRTPGPPPLRRRGGHYRYGSRSPMRGPPRCSSPCRTGSLAEIAEVAGRPGRPAPGHPGPPLLRGAGGRAPGPPARPGVPGGDPPSPAGHREPPLRGRALWGSSFAVSGEPGALAAARRLVGALDGRAITVPTARRPLYHAAAVLASNFLVVLLEDREPPLGGGRGLARRRRRPPSLRWPGGRWKMPEQLGLDRSLTGPVSGAMPRWWGSTCGRSPPRTGNSTGLARRALEMARPLPDPRAARGPRMTNR